MIIDRERDMRNIQKSWKNQGIKIGIEKGRLEGSQQAKHSFARKLIQSTNFDDRMVASLVGVEEEYVREIRAHL